MNWLHCIGLLGYLVVIVRGLPSPSVPVTSIGVLTTNSSPLENNANNSLTEIPVNSAQVYLDRLYGDARSRSVYDRPPVSTKKASGLKKRKKPEKLTSDFGSFSSTSFENKLPNKGKETEEDDSDYDEEEGDDDGDQDEEEEDDGNFGDFLYDELEELAPPVINALKKPAPPPYRLEEDQYDDDYYEDDVNYIQDKDDSDQDMSFASFFVDLFYEIFDKIIGSGNGGGVGSYENDEGYYDENNYAARRTTPRGLSKRKPKRPSYNEFLGFFEEEKSVKLESKSPEKEVAESKWLSWWDATEETNEIEATTQPMATTTTEGSWGVFNMFNNEDTSVAAPATTKKPPRETTSAFQERYVPTTEPPATNPPPVAQPPTHKSYKNFQLWRLKPINEEHLNALYSTRLYENEYQWWQGPTLEGKTDVLVPPSKVDEFREFLGEEEIKYTTTIRDLDMAIRFSHPQIPRSESFQLEAIQGHPMTWHRYHRYADIMKYFEYLHRKFPRNVDLIHIGRTFEGRPIVVVHIYERPPKRTPRKKQTLFIESGMRGREWIGPAVATWILEDLSRTNFRLTNRTLDGSALTREWYILPVANPDGYEYSQTTDRLWTKNRSRKKKTSVGFFSSLFSLTWFSKGNADQEDLKADDVCLGVDLGRNFDYRWNQDEHINSLSSCSSDYAGTRPFSESETRAVAKFLIKIAPTLRLYISLQSYGQLISLAPGKRLPLERFEAIESAESAVNSLRRFGLPLVKYFVDEDGSLRDSVAGSSDGFVTRELEIKRAFTIKLRDTGENGFLLPPSYIETVGRETFEMIKILVDDLRRRG